MKILLPSKNLGCLGFSVTRRLYFDFYRSGRWGVRFFCRAGLHRYRGNPFLPWTWHHVR